MLTRSSFGWQAGPFDGLVLQRGQRYILWADWHAYSFCTRCDEVGVSPPTTVDVPALEIKKRWSEEDKSAAGKVAAVEGGVSATLGLVSLGLDGTVVGLPAGVALGASSAAATLPGILAAKPQLSALAGGAAMLRGFAKRVQVHPTAAVR